MVGVPMDATDARIGSSQCAGRYQIWRKVADGGMGRVYQALDTQADRSVALKILHHAVAQDDIAVERFRREFEVSASLPHEEIVEVLAFEKTDDGSFALVMEYLEGEELRMLLQREKKLPLARILRMVSQVALGLAGAHSRKIVHRDLKPDNIFLCGTPDGDNIKILDFGSVRDNAEHAKKLTMMGTTIGSPFYMAPEQAKGLRELDAQADVWAMAAITYECITGSVPFQGATGPAILLSILTKDPRPLSEVAGDRGLPSAMEDLFEEALAKDPGIRTPTMSAFADALGSALGLSGDHRTWARRPEAKLQQQIEEGLKRGPIKPAASAATVDIRAMDAAFHAATAEAPSPPSATIDDDIVMGIPQKSSKLPLVIAGVVALIFGVVLGLLSR